METEVPEEDEKETSVSDSEWENRVLCSDGNCIGVIGPDGRCNECGKKSEGPLPEESSFEEGDQSAEEDVSPETAALNEKDEVSVDIEWEDRKLCIDGNCIGVIGADGRCKECGKPYK